MPSAILTRVLTITVFAVSVALSAFAVIQVAPDPGKPAQARRASATILGETGKTPDGRPGQPALKLSKAS